MLIVLVLTCSFEQSNRFEFSLVSSSLLIFYQFRSFFCLIPLLVDAVVVANVVLVAAVIFVGDISLVVLFILLMGSSLVC